MEFRTCVYFHELFLIDNKYLNNRLDSRTEISGYIVNLSSNHTILFQNFFNYSGHYFSQFTVNDFNMRSSECNNIYFFSSRCITFIGFHMYIKKWSISFKSNNLFFRNSSRYCNLYEYFLRKSYKVYFAHEISVAI